MKKAIFILMLFVFTSFAYGFVDYIYTYSDGETLFAANFTNATVRSTTLDIPFSAYIFNMTMLVNIIENGSQLTPNENGITFVDIFERTTVGNNWTFDGGGGLSIFNNKLNISANAGVSAYARHNTSGIIRASFNVNATNTNVRSTSYVLGNVSDDLIVCRINYDGSHPKEFSCEDATGYTLLTNITSNQAFNVSIINIDLINFTYNVEINGTLFDNGGQKYNFKNNHTNISQLYFQATNGFNIYVDSVELLFSLPFCVDIGNLDGDCAFTIGVISSDRNISLNVTKLNNLLYDGCTEGVISGASCILPIHFQTYAPSIFEIDINKTINYSYGFDNCSNSFNIPSNATALNISFYDSSSNPYSLDFESAFDYGYTTSYVANYSNEGKGNKFDMCIYPSWATLYTDALITYANFSYTTYQLELNNETKHIGLYTDTGTTEVTFTVLDYGTSPVQNAYIQILKYDPGVNSYTTSEILKTDASGQAVGNILVGSQFYKFIVQYQGVTRLIDPETQGIKIYTTTRTFRISLEGEEWFDQFDTTIGASTDLTFNNDTETFTYTWTDATGEMHNGCLKVVQTNNTGSTTLSDNCIASASSTIIYIIAQAAGNTYVATGYFKYDDIYVTNVLSILISRGNEFFKLKGGKEPLFFAWLLIVALALLGLPFPELSFILMSVGLIGTAALGMWNVTWGLVVAVVLLGFIQVYRGNK